MGKPYTAEKLFKRSISLIHIYNGLKLYYFTPHLNTVHYLKDDLICELNKTNILFISQVTFHHVCCILYGGSKSGRPVHTQEQGITEACEYREDHHHWGRL